MAEKNVGLNEVLDKLAEVNNTLDSVLDWYCDLKNIYEGEDEEVDEVAALIVETREFIKEKRG